MNPKVKTFTRHILNHMPLPVRRGTSWLDFRLSMIPLIQADVKSRRFARLGIVSISVDFEMAWAWRFAPRQATSPIEKGLHERHQVPLLLKEFQDYDIRATWATVAHLFLEKCSRSASGLAHSEMLRPAPFFGQGVQFSNGDWYQHDPCSDVRRDPAWYAPDLIEMILSATVNHEVACHSFSHLGFGSHCSKDVAMAEISNSLEVMSRIGVRPVSWIFPNHDCGHFALLQSCGFVAVRQTNTLPIIGMPHLRREGLWEIPNTSAIDRGKGWSDEQRLFRLKRLVDIAARKRLGMHLWLHPSLPSQLLRSVLRPFLIYCAEQRAKGLINVCTMQELASIMRGGFGLQESAGVQE